MENFTFHQDEIEPIHLDSYDGAFFENQIMNVQDLAEYLKLSSKTVYRMALRKDIPAKRVGRSYRFFRPEIIRWLTTGGNNGKRN